MGSAGYKGVIPVMEKEEADLLDKEVEPQTYNWCRRAKIWFYGMGGRLDPVTGKCLFTNEQLATPVASLNEAMQLIEQGKFHRDRENDELTRALGNKEKTGQTRGLDGSPALRHAFPEAMDSYRSRARKRKEEADRVKELQEIVQRHEKILESFTSQQGGSGPYREVDPALLDSTGPGSNRKAAWLPRSSRRMVMKQ